MCWMKIRILSSALFISTILNITYCWGQRDLVHIERRHCNYANKYSGEKLFILFDTDTGTLKSALDYWLDPFINMADSNKLKIVSKLLTFENDTSLCCMDATSRSFNGIEGCRGKPKNVNRFNIQIDALFMINRLCWPKTMEFYSCTPVLYDQKKKIVINSNPKKISLVFKDYIQWYQKCLKEGKVSKYFPFNEGRYVWYGGRKNNLAALTEKPHD